eukprot:CAMPEP_0168622334 /NCGR_PEP_ID=MMETSP0449_2-20121227/8207_1 /TAXON_ID=1082188 /ORGANISM="Strombidium rassoulzadegani, Strain ras09" /LENGTH=119 /DNA_ID=CAMNT_0008663583 /DNA_START=215 /DNA_END=570 /DNA_ORIENTATION=+
MILLKALRFIWLSKETVAEFLVNFLLLSYLEHVSGSIDSGDAEVATCMESLPHEPSSTAKINDPLVFRDVLVNNVLHQVELVIESGDSLNVVILGGILVVESLVFESVDAEVVSESPDV